MSEKTLKTRIALLYKTYEEWSAQTSYVPLKGEVCFCEIPIEAQVATTEPTVLFKVGDGETSFAELKWSSALAADVYNWAKKENLEFSDLSEIFLDELEEFVKEHGGGGSEIDTKYRIINKTANKDIWQLQKSTDGKTWVNAPGTIDISRKVDGELESEDGKSIVFNGGEDFSGAGVAYERPDGYTSFIGVDSGVDNNGIGAQIYDLNGDGRGSRIEVTPNGAYYTKGDDSAKKPALRLVPNNEIVTRKDLEDFGHALHYIGMVNLADGETIDQALLRAVEVYKATHPGYTLKEGAVAIVNHDSIGVEYIYNGTKWDEFGGEGLYETKRDAEESHRLLEGKIEAEIERAKIEEAKKVNTRITSNHGEALVFNEADGGGAKFNHVDGSQAFIGVNNGGKDGLMGQLYADVPGENGWSGTRINMYNDKFYYTNKEAVDSGVAKNDPDYEIATVGALNNLADIAKTGNVNDLIQDEGDFLVLDCNL